MLTSLMLMSLLSLAPAPAEAQPAAASSGDCILRPTYGTPLLVGDVTRQTIMLSASGDCGGLKGTALLVNSTDSQQKSIAQLTLEDSQWKLEVKSAIPAPSDPGKPLSGAWNVFASEGEMTAGKEALAQVFITPLPVVLQTKTTVVYEDAVLSEIVASRGKPSNVAYVANGSDFKDKLKNVASLGIPDVGPIKEWSIKSTDATILVDGTTCKPPEQGTDCIIQSPQAIEFRAKRSSPLPPRATIGAIRSGGESFALSVRLADSVEVSSAPLSIADIAYVLCQKDVRVGLDDVIRNNDLAAVTNSAVTNARCKIVISDEEISWAIARHHGLSHRRHVCNASYARESKTQYKGLEKAQEEVLRALGETECESRKARKGESITLLPDNATGDKVEELKTLYGQQRITVFVYSDENKRDASRSSFVFPATLEGRREVGIDFGGEQPSPDRPFHVEIAVQPFSDNGPLPAELDQLPERVYRSTLRPKGPFGITHRRGSLGSKGIRVFATVPVDFAAVRFPSAGLDIKSTRDTTAAQISTLTTGLLLTVEPWDYTRGVNMLAVPMRFQAGLLMSNWYKAEFQPSTYVGGAITLPLVRGTTQLDTDLALGVGWEVDLRNGYDSFAQRNHLLVTLGVNIFSLFGPQSAPKKK